MRKAIPGIFILLIFLTTSSGCDKFEYSPYQTETLKGIPKDLNNINILKLLANENTDDDTVTILYTGDSQRFYDELKNLVTKVNTMPEIDLMVLSGDLTDFGTLQEYLWIERELKKLNIPFLCTIGNHDLTANGEAIFVNMFGQKNYSFIYKGYKFIFHDTNGRKYGFDGNIPDITWLSKEIDDTTPDWFIGVSHIPPYDIDFDENLELSYKNLFASKKNFILSLHGHLHSTSDSYYYNDSVRYMTSNAVVKNQAILLKLINGRIIKQFIEY